MRSSRVLALCLGLFAANAGAQSTTDYDDDNDNLIDIRTLAQLNAVRYDLDGNGTVSASDRTNYTAAFTTPATGMGCASTCTGYELRQNLDFDTDGDNDVDSSDTGSYPNWSPIGGTYSATFEGNGFTISHLTIVDASGNAGLFDTVSGTVRNLGVADANVSTVASSSYYAGTLAAQISGGTVISSWTSGQVRAGTGSGIRAATGGVAGRLTGSNARLAASYSTANVRGSGDSSQYVGGLTGGVYNGPKIVACYATGAVNGGGSSYAGGLIGNNQGPSEVRASYFAGTVTNAGTAQGVTAENDGSDEDYYDVYFDAGTTGLSGGQSTANLQRPTDASGIYANWDDLDVNGNGSANEDPWHFGQSNQHPVLNYGALSAATQFAEQLVGQTDTAPSYSGISVSDKDFRRGIAIGSFVIPPPTGGNGTYDYTVTGLPTGLVFDEDGSGTCMAVRTVCGTPSVVGAVTVTVTVADADTNVAVTDRATLTFSVAVTEGRLIVSPNRLSLAEGGSGTYTVVLSAVPTGPVTVGVSSDNPAVTVGASTLTFTTQNWNTAQSVTVTGAGDADAVDEAATIANAASGGSYAASAFVRVGVADDERTGTDYDADNDGLIDVDSLAKLNAMRWDVDGDGAPSSGNAADYDAAFPGRTADMGCPDGPDANQLADACGGYALTVDLDFDTDDDGDVDADDAFASWTPVAGWATTFDGRGHTISNLTVTGSGDDRGLFATATTNATVRALGLLDVSVTGPGVRLGALAGVFNGRVAAVYATGVVRGAGGVAGLVAETQSTSARIVASYSTVAVECTASAGWARAGGLAARNDGTITTSYAVGAVTGDCPATVKGGLVSLNNGTVTASYWDAGLTGIADDGDTSPEDLSSSAMWTPTAYGASASDVYNAWDDQDVDGDGAVDADPWDFGTALNHPVLKWGGLDPADQRTDYDADGDRLVEISTLAQLDAVRWDLDGDGAPVSSATTSYFSAFFNPVFNPSGVGFCAPTEDDADDNDCLGYELLNDLDFDTDGSGSTHTNGAGDSDDAYYNADDGWVPIGPNATPGAATHYRARFDGNGRVIDNLFVKRSRNYSGLFSALSDAALVTSLGLPDAYVGDGQGTVGMLAGLNRGRVAAVWSSGSVTARGNVGGLVGAAQATATVVASYSTATVVCTQAGAYRAAGGLVGANGASSTIATSYSTGTVTGPCGLRRAFAYNEGTVAASYWDTTLSGIMDDTENPPQPPEGRTTAVLQAATDYDTLVGDPDEAIYASWDDQDVDGDGATGDDDDADPWDFGPSNQHPILKYRGLAAAPQLDAQPDTAPMFATSTLGAAVFQKDVAIQAFQVPAATGGNGVLSYAESGLPTGLVFDADGTGSCAGNAPRAVCGTPTATTTAPVTVTITVRDADGTVGATDEDELTFTVEVVVPSASIASPAALAEASLHNATVTVGLANTTFEGGVPAGSFALAIDPPLAGLSVGSVAPVGVGDTSAVLTLNYAGGNFDTVRTLSVTVPDSAHALVGALTTPTVNIVPTPSVAVSRTNLALTEGGASSTYAVVLGGQPTGTVTVRATSSDTDVARVDTDGTTPGLQNTLTFTPQNWNTARTVTVEPRDDDDAANESVTISHAVSPNYGATAASVGVTVADDETAAIVIDANPATANVADAGPVALSEGAATSTPYTVKLSALPTGTVTVTVTSTDADAATVDTDAATGLQSELTFTTGNWDTAQTAWLKAAADDDPNNEEVEILHTASNGGYDGVEARLAATVADSDVGVIVDTDPDTPGDQLTALALREGQTRTYTVRLSTLPTGGTVAVTVSSDNPAIDIAAGTSGGTFGSTANLQFNTQNWGTAQTVRVRPEEDADRVGERGTISNDPFGSGQYSSAATIDIAATARDDEATGTDHDEDDDNLIEIDSLAKLDAVRWDPDGDGTPSGSTSTYLSVFAGSVLAEDMGCLDGPDPDQEGDCAGYELVADLDFDTDDDGDVDADDAYPNWAPIGGVYSGTFHGNNRSISNLTTNGAGDRGLFAELGTGGRVSNLGLVDVAVTSVHTPRARAGGLAAVVRGTVVAVHVRGGAVSVTSYGFDAFAGGLAGDQAGGAIRACHATAAVSGDAGLNADAGGLVGRSRGAVAASYATGAVRGSGGLAGRFGGLVGRTDTAAAVITNSYATGAVAGSGSSPAIGGLVGQNAGGSASASYWDSDTTGRSSSALGTAQTTAGLQTPTAYGTSTDIFAAWDDYDTDDDGTVDAADDAWDFGSAYNYPALKHGGLDPASQRNDYDADSDGLIDISTVGQLHAMRWDVDGDGAPSSGNESSYFATSTFFNGVFNPSGVGFCPPTEDDADDNDCQGYELVADIDFDTDGSGAVDTNDRFSSWTPIPGWATVLDGGGHVIEHLTVSGVGDDRGLFSTATTAATVRSLGLVDVSVTGSGVRLAALAGTYNGRIAAVYSTGTVRGAGGVGGLVAEVRSASARIVASYSAVDVECTVNANWAHNGGLAARNDGVISASYAMGRITGSCPGTVKGGLVSNSPGTEPASYWDTNLTTIGDDTDSPPQPPEGKTTAVLQAPTDYDTVVGSPGEAIYASWDDQDVDGDGETGDGGDADPWDFGLSSQHPILKYGGLAAAPQLDAQPNLAPTFGMATVADRTFQKDVAIQPFEAPAASGGNGALTYAASGLPDGLVFDADGTGGCAGNVPRRVCGTPTAATTTTVTVTAHDADSNRMSADEATLTFTMEVVVPAAAISAPAALAEATLNGATATVALTNAAFEAGATAASFTPTTNLPGLRVASVATVNAGDTSATLTLGYSGGGFDTVRTLSVTVADSAHTLVGALTTPTVDIVPTPSVSVSRTSLALTEGGASSTYTVVLGGQPTGTVTVTATSSDTDVARVDTDTGTTGLQNTLSFTPTTWNTAQTVTVGPRDDDDAVDGSATISHAVSPNYGATAASVGVTVADDETAAIVIDADPATATVADSGPIALVEGATSTTPYTVKLSALPTGTVTVTATSADPGLVTVDTAAATGLQDTLTFTTGNWDTAQTAWLEAVDDDDPNSEEADIRHEANGGGYTGVSAILQAAVSDNDVGVLVDTDPNTPGDQLTALALREGQTRTYTVRLSTLPAGGNVTVTVTSANGAISATPGSLAFNAQNWTTARTVTVRGEQDGDRVGEWTDIANEANGAQYGGETTTVRATAEDDEMTGTDYDADGDFLIEIDSLAKLNAMRWDLDGDGSPSASTSTYQAAFAGSVLAEDMGCLDGPDAGDDGDCAGYELMADLDFDTDDDGDVDADDPNSYANWTPIGGSYRAAFHGNGRTIANLTTNGAGDRGLFGELGTGSSVSNLGLVDVAVTSIGSTRARAGGLAAVVQGTVAAVYVRGGTVSITSFGNDALAGGLAGVHAGGVLRACHATAAVSGAGLYIDVGGLAGLSQGAVVASYATGAVSGSGGGAGRFGGLVGRADTAAITNSYATGAVSGTGSTPATGGLVGQNASGTSTASYWNSETSGQSASALGAALTTAGLQTPTSATGTFAAWDGHDTDDDGTVDAADAAWDFGSAWNYPALKYGGQDPASQRNDYDADGDGLIEISTLAQLDAVRWDLDGDGAPASGAASSYFAASGTSTFANAVFNAAGTGLGCPTTTDDADDNDCKGYELLNDLDFDTDGSGATHTSGTGDANDAWNNGGEGWDPIGPATTVTATTHFNARFDGNGKLVANLFVNRSRDRSGLFAGLAADAKVVALGLRDAEVRGGNLLAGALAGEHFGFAGAAWSSGSVSGSDYVGGLAGFNNGTLVASYSTAAVACSSTSANTFAGGLVGQNQAGSIAASYSTGTVTGACSTLAGLAAETGVGTIADSYWDTGLSQIVDDTDDPPQPPEGKPTAVLQAPTDYDTLVGSPGEAIYSTWDDQDVDGDGATGDGDDADPWDFGRANQHPILKYRGLAAAPQLDAQPDTAPAFATSTLAAMTFPGGVAIQPFQLPAVTAGNGAYVYTPSGLPAGLSLGLPTCTTARTVCGTPTAATSTTATVTVNDGDSNEGPGDRDTVTFMVTVPAASARIVSTTPTALAETNLNSAAVTVVLSGTAFGASISPSGFQLATTPTIAGLAIATATRNSATSTTLQLRFDATDFTQQSTLSVRVRAATHRFGGDLDTGTVDVMPTLGVMLSATELALQEAPGNTNANEGSYTVVLTGQPDGAVTVTPTSGNDDVTVGGALTFNATNWNTAQTVTVTAGEDDDAVDDVAFVTHPVTGSSSVTSGPRVRVTVADDDSQGLTLATSTLAAGVTEGTTATYTVRLASAPTGVVAVPIASSDGAVTVDADAMAPGEQSTLLFNAMNWNAPRTVTVRAAEDDDGEGGTATLTHDPSGADYGDVADVEVTFTVTDNDAKGATLSATSLNVQENGTAEYTLVLDTQPVGGPVSVAVATAGTAVATAAPRTLTFTAENWKVPQTVAVSGVDDANTTDDAETITHTPSGGGYDGVAVADVAATAVDDDVAGLKVSPVNLTVAEGGTATYAVRLNVAPTAAATVTVGGATAKLTADADTGTTGDQTTLSFDATNWDTARTVTVAGVADADGEDETVGLTHAVTGTGNYASLALIRRPGVDVRVTDAQTAGVVAEPTSLTIDEGGTATYEVRLSAPPASGTTTVSVAASGMAGLTVATSTLRFDAASWATAQTVTVTAVADHDRLSDAEAALRHSVANYGAVMAGPDVRVTVRNVTVDHDADADGLIDIDSLAKLNAMRWDLDGDGTPAPSATSSFAAAFPNPRGGGVCPTPVSGVACVGYELTADLDFDTDGDGRTWTETGGVVGGDEDDDYYNGGLGWESIGADLATPFTGRFDGNGRIVRNLFLNHGSVRYRGLFGVVSGRLEAVGVADAWVRGDHGAGALVGFASASARVTGSWSTGAVSGDSSAGGLVGRTQTGARIAASYSTASVECRNGASGYAGGLAGGGSSGTTAVSTSWSAGAVSGACPDKAGLIGERAAATASYWDATASGIPDDGDLDAPEGLGTADLQRPTDYDGIYAAWNADLDGDGGPDDPWDFGTSSQYPSLKWGGFDATKQFAVPPPPEPETPEPETPAPETPGVVDLAPEVVSTLADLALDVGAAVELDLGAAFRDPEGGALTYRAESSHPRVASAALRGGILAVAALRPGEARVTATATDAGGQSASQSFAVRVGTVVSFAADASAPEGGAIRLALLASRPAPRRLEVPYVLSPAAEGASADAADHDGGAGGVAVFEEGAERTEIAIGIVDDDEVEPVRERFAVALSAPAADAGYGLGAKPSALATIEEGVCDREAAVRDALRGSLSCAAVADLSSRSSLRLAGAGVSRLRPEDLLGLSGLRLLELSGNRLSAWPGGALEMLPNLRSLRLGGNRIGSLPESLGEQSLLADLRLPGNGLSAVPPGALRGLSGLRRLDLSGNALEELPAGMFEGLAALREVRLQDNPGAPFLLTVELERTDAEAWAPGPASLSARVREGAPFPMEAVLAEPEGIALSIPAGAVRSGPATVEQDGAPLLLARLSSAPAVPDAECEQGQLLRPCFEGLATAAGPPLALFKRPPTVAGLEAQALESGGDDLRVELSERFESEDVLAYVAESSDESVARVRLRDGLLIVEAVGEGTATVTVVATDADGLAGTLRFEVRATEQLRSQWRGWRIVLLERASDDR